MSSFSNVLSDSQIYNICNLPKVKEAFSNIKGNGKIYFNAELPNDVKTVIKTTMGLDLFSITEVPMSWIKGDTPPHIDRGERPFKKNTHCIFDRQQWLNTY
jgi:hypothetical protein